MGYHFREGESFVRILELTPALRKQIEATIEHLLSVLDQFDGDESLEDDGSDEPWLGWPGAGANAVRLTGDNDDREAEDEYDEDGGDSEPSLGAPERHPFSLERHLWAGVYAPELLRPGTFPVRRVRECSQEHWADGLGGDHEREIENEHGGDILDEPHDGGEDDEEDYRGMDRL